MIINPRFHRIVAAQPYPLLFATITGAHLHGFTLWEWNSCVQDGGSPVLRENSVHLSGAHVLPLERVVGLDVRDETVDYFERLTVDIMTRDVRTFFGLPMRPTAKSRGIVLRRLPRRRILRKELSL